MRGTEARSPQARLEEAVGLAAAIDLEVAAALIAPVHRPTPSTFLGAGKVEEIRELLEGAEPRPGLVIVDHSLTPVQHRNLEKAWNAKVLDRTALILEIFGARARSAEGRLQVDLAHLSYQRSRLVRSWTHLERQRGGAGFLGGPGERQIEADRRALANKIDRIKDKLEDVRRTRSLQRAKRKRTPYPVVALVGYTNAGKSTLFNRMTASNTDAKDLLFATLDPTMRAVDLDSGQRVILSDTVGFISDLPTHLVAAFRATLEEVLEADLIIHVRDISHPDAEAQRQDVIGVLGALGVSADDERPFVEALNKIDLLSPEEQTRLAVSGRLSQEMTHPNIDEPARIAISALTGAGVGELERLIDRLTTADRSAYIVEISASDGAARAWLHATGTVESERELGDVARLSVRLSDKSKGQFAKAFPSARFANPEEALRWRA
ncbi:MAG: GTPase HflX [Alphaproteobacteria bacterium]|nr:GTPase HflX [Alphaproteobacteria bacterium]